MKSVIISLLLFLTINAQDGVTRFYVNRDASGSNNGTSRTNAWTHLSSISFAALSSGDTVYVSGGADSTVYNTNSTSGIIFGNISSGSGVYSFADGDPVIICPDWYPDHNGDVYLVSDNNSDSRILGVGNISNVKITGFNIIDRRTNAHGGIMQLGNADWDAANGWSIDSMIVVDNCHIVSKGFASLVTLSGTKNGFTNNYMETLENYYGYEQDQFGVNGGRGGHTISGNIIIARNRLSNTNYTANVAITTSSTSLTDTRLSMTTDQYLGAFVFDTTTQAGLVITGNTSDTFTGDGWVTWDEDGNSSPAATPSSGQAYQLLSDAHRDGFQFSNVGYPFGEDSLWTLNNERLTNTIANNLYIDYYPEGTGMNNMFYNYGWTVTTNARFNIYNNIFVNRKNQDGIGGIAIGRYYLDTTGYVYTEKNSIYILNNTIISKGTSGSVITGWAFDTLVIKNNLIVKDSVAPNILNLENRSDLWSAVIKGIDYNHYYEYGDISSPFAVAGGTNRTWGEWTGTDGFDTHGDSGNSTDVTFTDKYGLDISDYYTTTGRDLGTDLSGTYPFLSTDILGNSRSGTWDIGALEYQGVPVDSTPSNVSLSADYLSAELNTQYTAHIYDLTGFDSAYAHIDRGWYNIDGGAFKSTEWTKVFPNDDITLWDTSSTQYSTTQTITLTIGNASDTWTLRTKDSPINPTRKGVAKGSNGRIWYASDSKLIKLPDTSSYTPPVNEPDNTPPNPPTSLVATGQNSTDINIVWDNPIDADSIYLYEGTADDTTSMSLLIRLGAVESYLRTGLSAETTRWYAVKAVDDSGNVSYFSNTNDGTTDAEETGTPLDNLDLAYLTNSFAAHLYNHSLYGSAGSTNMPAEMTAYNTANSSDGSLTRITPDYPDCGDMIWHWNQTFFGGGVWGCDENVITEYAETSTYDILQVTFGFNSAALITDIGLDTVNYSGVAHTVENYKYWIRNMVAAMELHPDKYWILWDIPPEDSSAGNSAIDVLNQANFNKWMVDTLQAGLDSYGAFPNNVYIYDVFSILKSGWSNWMNPNYSDGGEDGDSHPNQNGQDAVAIDYIPKVFNRARAYRIP